MTPRHLLMSLTPTSPKIEENFPEDIHSNDLFLALQTISTAWDSELKFRLKIPILSVFLFEWEGEAAYSQLLCLLPSTLSLFLSSHTESSYSVENPSHVLIWRQTFPLAETKRQCMSWARSLYENGS